jgi:hypothetical protein
VWFEASVNKGISSLLSFGISSIRHAFGFKKLTRSFAITFRRDEYEVSKKSETCFPSGDFNRINV